MRFIRLAIAAACLTVAGAVQAAERLVVVELFTSQGCSSCPPADAILTELATRTDVLPLAFHVDYWDYIGWKDHYASPAFTERQRTYARNTGDRSVYTPQLIVGGLDKVIGAKPMKLAQLIERHHGKPKLVDITATRNGGTVDVAAEARQPSPGQYVVVLVTYRPAETVEIKRGENAGRTITYSNIVLGLVEIGRWDGQGGFRGSAPVKAAPSDRFAVIVQNRRQGPILAAAYVR